MGAIQTGGPGVIGSRGNLPLEDVKAIDHESVAAWLGLTPARERHKYGCVWCESSDALHIDATRIRCYSCGESGTNIDLVMARLGLNLRDAVRALAEEFGVLALPGPSTPTMAVARPIHAEIIERSELDSRRPAVYQAVLDTLILTPGAQRFLTDRGLPFHRTAEEYGFRGLDFRADWEDLWRALRRRFAESELRDILMPRNPTTGERQMLPWAGRHGALVIPYLYHGEVLGLRFRKYQPRDRRDRYRDLGGQPPLFPFNADALDGCAGEELHVMEGELNAFVLWGQHNLRVIGLPGAATPWRAEWSPRVSGVRRLVAWYDQDKAGLAGAERLAVQLSSDLGSDWVEAHAEQVVLPVGRDVNDLFREGVLGEYVGPAGH